MHHRPPRHFLQQQKISKHLYCSICHQVFDNPTRMRCGHTFCYECMFNWRKLKKTCPECKNSIQKWQPEKDLVAAHIIDDFGVRCVFGKCEWQGVYAGLKKHQRFCGFREKRRFDEVEGEEVVKVVDEEEEKGESEVREVGVEGDEQREKHKRGKKKVKKNQDNNQRMPRFSQSSYQSQPQSINIQPLEPNRRSHPLSHHQSQPISNHQNPNQQSSSSDDYLQTNLAKIIKNRQYSHQQNNRPSQQCFNDEEKKERNGEKRLEGVRFYQEEDREERLYPRHDEEKRQFYGSRKRSRNSYRPARENQQDDPQQEFFRLLQFKQQQPPNLYIYQRYLQQQQKLKKQKAQRLATPRWNIVHHNSSSSKAEDDDDDSSNMSNPFDQPIEDTTIRRNKKNSRNSKVSRVPKSKSKVKQIIVLDSSEESSVEMSKESGEISQMLNNGPVVEKVMTSVVTQVNEVVGDDGKDKQLIERKQMGQVQLQMRKLSHQNVKRQFEQSKYKKNLSKSDSVEY